MGPARVGTAQGNTDSAVPGGPMSVTPGLPAQGLCPGTHGGARSLCHGSVPVLHIKFTLTGDYTALCKARPPAAALQVGTGVPRAPKGGAQEAAGVGDTQA